MRTGLIAVGIVAVLFACTLFVFMPDDAYAHGSGLTLSATTSVGYVDIDYNDFAVYTRETGRFDLKLFKDPERTQPVPFTRIWVRITQRSELPEGETIFSGWVAKPSFGPTGFSIALPDPGEYLLLVRYVNGDTAVEEATVPFSVINRNEPSIVDRSFIVGGISGIALATLVLGAFLATRAAIRRRP